MDCVPPWLSSEKQCFNNITYNHSKDQIMQMITDKFFNPKDEWKATEAETRCNNPCKTMNNKVNFLGMKPYDYTRLDVRFERSVRVEKKVIVYTLFNFIIDIGKDILVYS